MDGKNSVQTIHSFETVNHGRHILATPLLDVLSINVVFNDASTTSYVSNYNNQGCRTCKIWGSITIVDKDNNHVVDIYSRNEDCPDTVISGGFISINGPDYIPVIPHTGYKIRVCLTDGLRKLADDAISLYDTMTTRDFEKIKSVQAKGEDGYATVRYTTFQAAVIAIVEEVKLISKVADHDQSRHFSDHNDDICATIVARYGDSDGFPCNDVLKEHSSVLFDNRVDDDDDESLKVNFDAPIKLSKSKMGVPAYSSLIIEARIWDKSTKDNLVTISHDAAPYTENVKFRILQAPSMDEEGVQVNNNWLQHCHLEVRMHWHNARVLALLPSIPVRVFKWIPPEDNEEASEDEESTIWDEEEISEDETKASTDEDEESSATRLSYSEGDDKNLDVTIKGVRMVEVYSVFIGPNNDNVLRIHGTIEIEDAWHKLFMFNREKDAAEKLSPNNRFISLNEPCHGLDGYFFNMEIDLKDDDDRIVSKGGKMMWNSVLMDANPIKWYNHNICSVIRGENGYFATVYYSIFEEAIATKVCVSFTTKTSTSFSTGVWGKIVGRLECFDELEPFEKEFYQITLFAKPREDEEQMTRCIDMGSASPLKLSKSVVSVPTNSALILDMDLQVDFLDTKIGEEASVGTFDTKASMGNVEHRISHLETVKEEAMVFRPFCDSCRRINKPNYYMTVSVKWGEVGHEA